MPIAASGGPIVYSDSIRGDSKSHLLEDLDEALTSADWSPASISGGTEYTIASAQSLGAKVRITAGPQSFIQIQFLSLDETKVGAPHLLGSSGATPRIDGGFFQLWVNRCQIFLSMPGLDAAPSFHLGFVQGGIPWVPPESLGRCSGDISGSLTTQAWWSAGDGSNFDGANFRNAFALGTNGRWSACHNTSLLAGLGGGATALNSLRLVPKAISQNSTFGGAARMQFFGGRPLYLDPQIAWGRAVSGSTALVRGVLYDAMIPSLPRPIDYLDVVCDVPWINYMHHKAPGEASSVLAAQAGTEYSTRWASLYLLLGLPAGEGRRGNYVY